MLSYQHAYHAGGPADLHKHIVLAELLAAMTRKPRGLTYMETHAGRGVYDLSRPEATRTGEAEAGIARLSPDPETPFGRALALVRTICGPGFYPGSPAIARALLRPTDRMALMELHPQEHAALRAEFGTGDGTGPALAVHRRDGPEGVLALSPPEPRRGLVLVDPSYEVKDEYAATARFVLRLLAKWPEAVVMIWYPILPAFRHEGLVDLLSPLPLLRDEVAFDLKGGAGMLGSGILIANPPHGTEACFRAALKQAAGVLREPG